MNNKNMKYVKKGNSLAKVIRTELIFTPLLIVFPLVVGFFLIFDWYFRGVAVGETGYTEEMLLGIIIIIGNIAFDIPFIKSLKAFSKKR